MKKALKLVTAVFLCAALCSGILPAPASLKGETVYADPIWPAGPDVISETAVLMDADTGVILYDKDMDRVLYPASTAKIMTCLLALENGNLEDTVTMTQTGVYYAQTGSSNLLTKIGEEFTLEQLLYGTMLKSANDMATQVGEYIGGTIENFVDMMNARAAELGCTHTHFTNACGMPDKEMVTTAHDLALISQEALKNETFRKITGTHAYSIPPTNLTNGTREFTNHNPLLVNPDYAYPGIIGGKTGYTDSALNTLVTFVAQNGHTLIAATLMASDATYAASDHRALYDFGFNSFDYVEVVPAEYVEEGGIAIVPDGTDPSCLTEWDSEEDGSLIRKTFVFGEKEVGSALMTAENAEAYAKAVEEEQARLEEERRKSEEEKKKQEKAEEPESKDDDGTVTDEEVEDGDDYLSALKRVITNWRDYVTPTRIALAVLALLVLILLIIMIRSAARRRRARRRRRRRRR